MTIREGEPWGEIVDRPTGLPRFETPRALGHALEEQIDNGGSFACFLDSANVRLLLGVERSFTTSCLRVSFDALHVEVANNAKVQTFVAVDTVEIGRSYFHGEWMIVTNTGFWRGRRIASRAHPNDGRVDIVTVDPHMTFRQRVLARHRMRLSAHLPHPHLSMKQVDTVSWSGTPRTVHIDGMRLRAIDSLRVTVIPDAVVLYI